MRIDFTAREIRTLLDAVKYQYERVDHILLNDQTTHAERCEAQAVMLRLITIRCELEATLRAG